MDRAFLQVCRWRLERHDALDGRTRPRSLCTWISLEEGETLLKKSTSKIWSCDFDLKEIRETMAELEHLRQRMDQMMNNLSQSSMKVENLWEGFPSVNLTEDEDYYYFKRVPEMKAEKR